MRLHVSRHAAPRGAARRLGIPLLLVAALAAVFLVPSPADRAAQQERTALVDEVDRLRDELAATNERLEATSTALGEEVEARRVAEGDLDAAVTELRSLGETQYGSIVTAFTEAAVVACGEDSAGSGTDLPLVKMAECNSAELAIVAGELASQPRVCGVIPVGAIGGAELDECVLLYAHSDEVLIDELAVTSWAGDGYRAVLQTPVAVSAGDTLDVSGYFRVTNDLPANVGVAGHLWAYDLDGDRTKQWRIGPASGDNVDRARHHMPVTLSTVYQVPADWPVGHRMMIEIKADAHSTATDGDLSVDDNGNLIVRIARG